MGIDNLYNKPKYEFVNQLDHIDLSIAGNML